MQQGHTPRRLVFQPRNAPSNPLRASGMSFEPMLEATCSFDPEIHLRVLMNMVKNPNFTSSHLFRADIFHDSADNGPCCVEPPSNAEGRPLAFAVPSFEWKRTIVRQLIPRNPNLDRPLTQTCHFFQRQDKLEETVQNLVVYLPHASCAEDIPWYHPTVASLAVLHTWPNDAASDVLTPQGQISIHFSFFAGAERTTRQERTALNFLKIIHKHGEGQRVGYTKRVHHDLVIPQARFQNTYSRLKIKYAKELISGWVEQTPPEKHVFEDLGIAAWLIELWSDVYASNLPTDKDSSPHTDSASATTKAPFPGFVDIGCGNGVLVYILLLEGFKGWGFDARHRKTWTTLPSWVQANLKERILIPEPFEHSAADTTEKQSLRGCLEQLTISTESETPPKLLPAADGDFTTGVFPNSPFIISNHADELTAWTPLLAYLSNSPFVSIPCCSHDLSGARFRAPASPKDSATSSHNPSVVTDASAARPGAAETGSLAARPNRKAPSAFASLCLYVEKLALEVGFEPEREVLRIPSTRNTAVLGRSMSNGDAQGTREEYEMKRAKVVGILERELRMDVADVASAWIHRANQIARTKGEGH